MKGTAIYHSPVGAIQLDWEDGAVTALKTPQADAKADAPNELVESVFRQVDEYFAGTRRVFDFPYRLHGTPFQEKVWAALSRSLTAKPAAIKTSPGPLGTRRPFVRLAWQITQTLFLSPSPATASSVQTEALPATEADWQ